MTSVRPLLAVALGLGFPPYSQARPSHIKARQRRGREDDDDSSEDESDDEYGDSRPTTTRRRTSSPARRSSTGTLTRSRTSTPQRSDEAAQESTVVDRNQAHNKALGGLGKGGIIGVSLAGAVVLVVILMLIATCYIRKRRAKKKPRRMSTFREFFRPSLRRSRGGQQQTSPSTDGMLAEDAPISYTLTDPPVGQNQDLQSPLSPPPGLGRYDESQPSGNEKGVRLTYPDSPPTPPPHLSYPLPTLHEGIQSSLHKGRALGSLNDGDQQQYQEAEHRRASTAPMVLPHTEDSHSRGKKSQGFSTAHYPISPPPYTVTNQ